MSFERDLHDLAAEVEWPPTPQLSIAYPDQPHLLSRRRAGIALLGVALALTAALAVASSRAGILHFFGIGAIRIEVVQSLPPAREQSLGAKIGPRISRQAASRVLHGAPLLPPLTPPPALHVLGGVVSLLFAYQGSPVQLSELYNGPSDAALLHKLVSGDTRLTWLRIDGRQAVWISGGQHVLAFPTGARELVGNTLIWERGNLTLRLQGKTLSLDNAEAAAHSLRRAPPSNPLSTCGKSQPVQVGSAQQTLVVGHGPVLLVAVAGHGQARLSIAHSAPDKLGWRGQKTPWLVRTSYRGPVTVTAHRIDRPGKVRLAYVYGQHLPKLVFPHDNYAPPVNGYYGLPSDALFRSTGCYAFNVSGRGFAERLVVRVVG